MPQTVFKNDAEYARADTAGMLRLEKTLTATITSALSDVIDMRLYSGGILHLPAQWTAANIGFKVSSTSGGTFQPLYRDDANTLVQIGGASYSPAASKSYAIPVEVFGARYIKLWSQSSGSDEAQASPRSVAIDLKA